MAKTRKPARRDSRRPGNLGPLAVLFLPPILLVAATAGWLQWNAADTAARVAALAPTAEAALTPAEPSAPRPDAAHPTADPADAQPRETPPLDALDALKSADFAAEPADAPPIMPTPAAAKPSSAAPTAAPAWRAHSRPFADEARPRLAVVVSELGFLAADVQIAIDDLPPEVTLAFDPRAPEVARWVAAARAAGHEVLLGVPMEPFGVVHDPGPNALYAAAPPSETLARLEHVLGAADAYVGVVDIGGGRLLADATALEPIFGALRDKGLLFLDSGAAAVSFADAMAARLSLPYAAGRVVDPLAAEVDLDAMADMARRNGAAVAVVPASPGALRYLRDRLPRLDAAGVALAPLTAATRTP